jgi:signal transduction histidine kinase
MVIPLMPEVSEQQQLLLASLPPSQGQYRLALSIVAALVVAFGISAFFANLQLPRVDAFIPAVETAIFINDAITSVLLFSQFAIVRRRALLALASGYYFMALIVIPHALTFPGLIAPAGFLGAGPQTTAWLYILWHLGLPLASIAYALFGATESPKLTSEYTPQAAISLSVTIVVVLVCGLVWITIGQEMRLPIILDDSGHLSLFGVFVNLLLIFFAAFALLAIWVQRRSVLDLWLMVAIIALLIEILLSALLAGTRFSLGYYAGRIFSVIVAIVVLTAMLAQTTTLYADLAQSILRRRATREARLIAMDTMAAAISHEVSQPVTAMVTNANAALRWLARTSPDLNEVRTSLEHIVNDGHRVSGVIGGIRSMFKKEVRGRLLLNANDLVREALAMVDLDLRNQGVTVTTDFRNDLPSLRADRGQLLQVFLNLIANSIEAMSSVTDRARVLRVRTDVMRDLSGVVVTIEDSGTGIDGKDKDQIFGPFFTTKSAGTGIGLTICRSIVESHGGDLRASANKPHGAIFQVTLPCGEIEM